MWYYTVRPATNRVEDEMAAGRTGEEEVKVAVDMAAVVMEAVSVVVEKVERTEVCLQL